MRTSDIPTRDDPTGPVPTASLPPASAPAAGRSGAGLLPWSVAVLGALICLCSGVWFFHHRAGGDGRPALMVISGLLAVLCLGYAAVAARDRRR